MATCKQTITGVGLEHLGLCSALRAFEKGGIFTLPHLLWHGASVFPVSSEGTPPFSRLLTTHKGMWRIYSNPDPHGSVSQWFWLRVTSLNESRLRTCCERDWSIGDASSSLARDPVSVFYPEVIFKPILKLWDWCHVILALSSAYFRYFM
jgi:hypothetical protein